MILIVENYLKQQTFQIEKQRAKHIEEVLKQPPTESQLEVDTSKGSLPIKAVERLGDEIVRRKSLRAVDMEKAMVNRKSIELLGEAEVAGTKPSRILGGERSKKFAEAEKVHEDNIKKERLKLSRQSTERILRQQPTEDQLQFNGKAPRKAINLLGESRIAGTKAYKVLGD